MKRYSIIVTLAIIATARCGIIERGFETLGDAAHLAHEEASDMFSTGKNILFGKGIRAGPDPVDQGLIPGFAHKIGEGFHLFGDGISHVFAGDDGIHSPLSMMKSKMAHHNAAVPAPSSVPASVPESDLSAVPASNPVPDSIPSGPGMAETPDVVPNP